MNSQSPPQHSRRVEKDIRDFVNNALDLNRLKSSIVSNPMCHGCSLEFVVCIREGPYHHSHHQFSLVVPAAYPFVPPTAFSLKPLWHPNVDLYSGQVNVSLDWSPVLTLSHYVLALQLLFVEPSGDRVANIECYSRYCQTGIESFTGYVRGTLAGGKYFGLDFSQLNQLSCEECNKSCGGLGMYTSSSTAQAAGQGDYPVCGNDANAGSYLPPPGLISARLVSNWAASSSSSSSCIIGEALNGDAVGIGLLSGLKTHAAHHSNSTISHEDRCHAGKRKWNISEALDAPTPSESAYEGSTKGRSYAACNKALKHSYQQKYHSSLSPDHLQQQHVSQPPTTSATAMVSMELGQISNLHIGHGALG